MFFGVILSFTIIFTEPVASVKASVNNTRHVFTLKCRLCDR